MRCGLLATITNAVAVEDARQRLRAQPLPTQFAAVRWLVCGTEGRKQWYAIYLSSCTRHRLVRLATAVLPKIPHSNSCKRVLPIGLHDPAEADLELFCNSWSAEFLGGRL